MKTTKVFKSGNSMAIRIPKDFYIRGNKVEIIKHNGDIIIREIPQNINQAFAILTAMPDDFFAQERTDLPPQKREPL